MTDIYAGFIVTLENDIRSDDAEHTINAIKQIRGVLSVEPVVSDFELAIAEGRVRHELGTKLLKVIYP